MAFTWISTNVGLKITATHLNEVQTNINTVATSLGKPYSSWPSTPLVSSGGINDDTKFQALRNGADHIHTWNYCWAEKTSHDSTVNSSKLVAVDSSNYAHCASNYAYCGTNLTVEHDAEYSSNFAHGYWK